MLQAPPVSSTPYQYPQFNLVINYTRIDRTYDMLLLLKYIVHRIILNSNPSLLSTLLLFTQMLVPRMSNHVFMYVPKYYIYLTIQDLFHSLCRE